MFSATLWWKIFVPFNEDVMFLPHDAT